MNFAQLKTSDTAITRGASYISTRSTEEPLGKLFLLLEFRDRQTNKHKLNLSEIINSITENYYSKTADNDTTIDIERRLEDLAGDINAHIQNYFSFQSIDELIKYVDVFIGVVHRHTLVFTKTKRIHVLLQHGLSLIDITEEDDEEDDELENDSFFSYITSGTITAGDSMIATTDALLDYFSKEKLKSILSLHTAQTAIVELEKLVEEFTKQTLLV